LLGLETFASNLVARWAPPALVTEASVVLAGITETPSIAAIRASLHTAVNTRVTGIANTLTGALAHAMKRACIGTGRQIAGIASVATLAVASAIDTFALIRTTIGAVPGGTVIACPSVVANADILGASTVATAVVFAGLLFATDTSPAVHASARSISTLATATAIHRAAALSAELAIVSTLTNACAVAAVTMARTTASIVFRALAKHDFARFTMVSTDALASAILALTALVAFILAQLDAAIFARVELRTKTDTLRGANAIAIAVIRALFRVAIDAFETWVALALSSLSIAFAIATAQLSCDRVASTLLNGAVFATEARATFACSVQKFGVDPAATVVLAGWRANSSSTCLPIPTRGASANALLGVAETVSTALYGLRIGLFCFQSARAECCLAGVAEETDLAFASAFVADTTATALHGSTIARALASRALGVGAVFASPALCALTNGLLSIGVAETMSLLLEAVVGATLGSAIMALPTRVAATLGNGRLQIASAMTTALLRRTLGHRASTVGAIGTAVTIVALAHTSFLADAMVTAATWADRNAASITHPWASAAARSVAVHNFASAMTTATVGALAGTSS
jgi:hypothetical protein